MRYILWVVALLEACDVTKMVAILAAIFDFTKNWKQAENWKQAKTARYGNLLCCT